MSSSRSIAAARARRSNEQAPPMSGTRPGTSIGSHAAFVPQTQQYQQPTNIRLSRSGPQTQPQMQQPQQQILQQQQMQPTNGLPFNKLSISDAIGLITLRLGRVEQFIIDMEIDQNSGNGNTNNSSLSIPDNSKIIDTSVLNNIVSRLDSLEKKDNSGYSNSILKINEEISTIRNEIQQYNDKIQTQMEATNEIRELVNNLKNTFELYVKDTNDKFIDYEGAIAELEQNFQFSQKETTENDNSTLVELEGENTETSNDNGAILSVDLKNIIKQELANI